MDGEQGTSSESKDVAGKLPGVADVHEPVVVDDVFVDTIRINLYTVLVICHWTVQKFCPINTHLFLVPTLSRIFIRTCLKSDITTIEMS